MDDTLEKKSDSAMVDPPPASLVEEEFAVRLIDFDDLLRNNDLETAALRLSEGAFEIADFMRKDTIDRFIDFVFFKVSTGNVDIPSMAYPTKRMLDRELEGKIAELINNHLYPEIIFRLLKFFTRNVHDSDTNLYIANLISSEDIIKSIYDTYVLFKKDIYMSDRDRRTLNVKRIQQYSPRSENKLSSPLDAAARLKYILEFFLFKYDVSGIYTKEDLRMWRPGEPAPA
ncbi:MAG: hypothetical protein JXA07_10570 [Spirochaetes bacterium]|nr:hypothetical protein [Spirochaetota bacterium]